MINLQMCSFNIDRGISFYYAAVKVKNVLYCGAGERGEGAEDNVVAGESRCEWLVALCLSTHDK